MTGSDRTDGASSGDDTGRGAPDHFALLADETRLETLRVLADERRENWRPSGLRFAELRRAVGVDDAGTFNYHLEKLVGTYVYEDDGTYVLTNSGLEIVDAVLAGRYGGDDRRLTGEIDDVCPTCGGSLTAIHERGWIRVVCDEHGIVLGTTLPSGAAVGREIDAVVDIAVRDLLNDTEWGMRGVCFRCWGAMDREVQFGTPDRHPATGESLDAAQRVADPDEPVAVFGCSRCETVFWGSVTAALLRAEPVVAFATDHGVERESVRALFETGTVTVERRDPPRLAVSFDAPEGDATLRVTVDRGLSTTAVERTDE
ncbi:hypothetical protein RYH80_14065 [Halobaculum sp. MBLA0147]|uniref:DUF7351 domain-containing protein n=1 Tax=Halobaculum sp. MBLA0147 TaxID=3079934 RepID=UPI003526597D